MKKKLLSLIAAGLMLCGVPQIKAMDPAVVLYLACRILVSLPPTYLYLDEYQSAALGSRNFTATQHDGLKIISTCSAKQDLILGTRLHLFDPYRNTRLAFIPFIKPKENEPIANYVARVETQKQLLLNKYVQRHIEESSTSDEGL